MSESLPVLDSIERWEIDGHSRLLSLITVLTAGNTVALWAVLLYLADLYTGIEALKLGLGASLLLFALHLVVSRLPTIIRAGRRVKVDFEPDSKMLDLFVFGLVGVTVVVFVSSFVFGFEPVGRFLMRASRYSAHLILLSGFLFLLAFLRGDAADN